MESKGLDIVRRDWCPLARTLGRAVLELVLSGREQDDIVEAVHAALRDAAARVTAGRAALGEFAVTKQLTKRPEEYPDAKAQAHVQVRRRRCAPRLCVTRCVTALRVLAGSLSGRSDRSSPPRWLQVALRMRARGAREGTQPGDTVQYVICKDCGGGGGGGEGGAGLAQRAYHPQEVLDNPNLQVDAQYYLSHQLHPVVARLCAPLEATSDARLAECLGLDPARFRSAAPAYDAIAEARTNCVALILQCLLLASDICGCGWRSTRFAHATQPARRSTAPRARACCKTTTTASWGCRRCSSPRPTAPPSRSATSRASRAAGRPPPLVATGVSRRRATRHSFWRRRGALETPARGCRRRSSQTRYGHPACRTRCWRARAAGAVVTVRVRRAGGAGGARRHAHRVRLRAPRR